MNNQVQRCSRYRFGLPLDEREAREDISGRKKALEIALTSGYDLFIFLLESRMAVYDATTALCIHPMPDGTFEIRTPSFGGNNIPECAPGINFLWSSEDKQSFRLEAASSFDNWLLEYAAFVGHRLQPKCPKLWRDEFCAPKLTSIVGSYWTMKKNMEEAEKDNMICLACKNFEMQFGVCCTRCHRWAHVSCLDKSEMTDVSKEDLPMNYVCTSCLDT